MKKGLLALLCTCVILGVPACGKKDGQGKAPKKEKTVKKDVKKPAKDHAKKGMDKAKGMGY